MRSRLALGSLALITCAVTGCGDNLESEPDIPSITQPTDLPSQPTPSDPESPTSEPETPSEEPDGPGSGPPRAVGAIAEGLELPWGIDFLPDGAAVVTERMSARVLRLTPDGALAELGRVDAAAPQGEAGLLGVAVSPTFGTDDYLYLYVTTESDNRVVRARVEGDRLGEPDVILDGIPQGFVHDGGRIAFGPDGYLYVATGETGDRDLAQDPDSLAGKILRITPEGDPAPGNPDPSSAVWSLGHRNVQGLAWDDQGRLWASEFGDSDWDELNLIEPGGNYGWPEVEGAGGGPGFIDPALVWPVADASPSGLAFADGRLWMAALRGERLWRIDVSATGVASRPTAFFTDVFGRLRTVAAAPDGTLWVSTSNRDNRGNPDPEDDRVLRVRPSSSR